MYSYPHCPVSNALKQHLRRHTGEKPFSCEQCPAKFTQRSSLKRHLLSVHSDEKPYSCDHCFTRFSLKTLLRAHSTVHPDPGNFACPQCPAKFKHASSLWSHLNIHSIQAAYSCVHCSAKFNTKEQLSNHITKQLCQPSYPRWHCPIPSEENSAFQQSSKEDRSAESCTEFNPSPDLKEHSDPHLIVERHFNEHLTSESNLEKVCSEFLSKFKCDSNFWEHFDVLLVEGNNLHERKAIRMSQMKSHPGVHLVKVMQLQRHSIVNPN